MLQHRTFSHFSNDVYEKSDIYLQKGYKHCAQSSNRPEGTSLLPESIIKFAEMFRKKTREAREFERPAFQFCGAFCGILLMQMPCRSADEPKVTITSHMASLHALLVLKCTTVKQEWQHKFIACHSFALMSSKSLDRCQISFYRKMLLVVLVKASTVSLTIAHTQTLGIIYYWYEWYLKLRGLHWKRPAS